MSEEKKQSIVAGALTGTLGIFITKAIGLLYVIPFNEIAQSETDFYSYGYTIYNYILEICLAGIPYAIAALIAKYMAVEDYEAAAIIRKITRKLLLVTGIVCCLFMIVFSKQLALRVIATNIEASQYAIYVAKTRNVMIIISFAMIFVPFLSYYRGIYQGMKRFDTYAFTQVLEQVIRVAFLLSMGFITVYVFKMERIVSVYMAMAAASVAAIGCILYYRRIDKDNMLNSVEITDKSRNRELLKEVLKYSLPYLSSSIFTNISCIIVLFMFTSGLEKYGMNGIDITNYQGLINYQTTKIIAIPQIISTGFSVAIIPYLSAAVGKSDEKEAGSLVNKVVKTVLYFAIPLITFMIIYSEEIYYVMYGGYQFVRGVEVLRKQLLLMLFQIMMQVASSILLAVNMRKEYFIMEFSRCVIYILVMPLMLSHFGINGYFLTFSIVYLLSFIIDLMIVDRKINFDQKEVFFKILKIIVSAVPVFLTFFLRKIIGIDVLETSRIKILLYGFLMGIISMLAYLGCTSLTGIMQELFEFDFSIESLKKIIKRFI